MTNPVRTRFAPSPTGHLHIGGARTALFSWLYTRRHGGDFILRIEDTDLERSTTESVNAILEGMAWLGLEYDEGPFYQTHRFDRYKEVIQQLLDQGHAYRCNCSRERLDAVRAEQQKNKQKPRYDGHCRDKALGPSESSCVVRFRNPDEGDVVINDMIRGKVVINNRELDDLIIARSDGSPTYNLTVVVDDLDMKVNHVIRGDDHLNNTPRQINILKALGQEPPSYAHVPMILGDDGKRMSKRHGAVSVMQYREEGYLPEALINYLVRLGWSQGDQEIFSLEEMIQSFNIGDVNRAASTFNPEKLLWINQHYIKNGEPAHLVHHLSWHMGQLGIDPSQGQGPSLTDVVQIQRERVKTLREMAEGSRCFYQDFDEFEEKAAKKHLRGVVQKAFTELHERLQNVEWKQQALHQMVQDCADACEMKLAKIAQPLRVAVTGGGVSPSIDATLYLVGRHRCLERIQMAIDYIEQRMANQ